MNCVQQRVNEGFDDGFSGKGSGAICTRIMVIWTWFERRIPEQEGVVTKNGNKAKDIDTQSSKYYEQFRNGMANVEDHGAAKK